MLCKNGSRGPNEGPISVLLDAFDKHHNFVRLEMISFCCKALSKKLCPEDFCRTQHEVTSYDP